MVRLADRLPVAQVATPLAAIEAADDVDALPGPVASRELADLDFEGDPASPSRGCRVEAAGSGRAGRALRCAGGARLRLPAGPDLTLRLRASLRAEGSRCELAAVRVVQRSREKGLAIHELQDLPPGRWLDREVLLRTGPDVRALDVHLPDPDCEIRVDDLRLEALELTRAQDLALLKAGLSGAPEGSPGRLLRRGRLLPVPDPREAAPPRDDSYTVRDAIFAPAPSDLSFELRVPPAAALHFAYGLAGESHRGDAVGFRVTLRKDGAEHALFDDALRLDSLEDWYWRHARVDLSAWAGQSVRLRFATRADSGRGYALWGAPIVARERVPGDPPSAVLVVVDTLRLDRLAAWGYAAPPTPHLAALARDGIRFDQAISAANWTAPAFHSLFTGLSAPEVAERVPPDHTTLAERFAAAGWLTHAIAYKPTLYDRGFDQGFDGYFNVSRVRVRGDRTVARALDWLRVHHRERFFLFLHLDDPHQPFTQPASHLPERVREGLERWNLELPFAVRSLSEPGCAGCARNGAVLPELRALVRELYDDEVRYADEQVGVLLDGLRAQGVYEDAIVAFAADHGESLWQHEELYHHAGPGLYDELVRVPLLVKPPRPSASLRGRAIETQVRLADLAPTLLELAGIPFDAEAMGARSLVSLFEAGSAPDRPALSRGSDSVAIRTGGWKYVRRFEGDAVREQLFDLRGDPGETRDLSSSGRERHVAALLELRAHLLRELLRARELPALLVRGDTGDRPASLRVQCREARAVPELAHPPMRVERADADAPVLAYDGPLVGPLLAFVPLQVRPGAECRVEVDVPGDPPLGVRRTLRPRQAERFPAERLSAELPSPAEIDVLWVGRSPERSAPGSRTLDARNLEALRQLGYIE